MSRLKYDYNMLKDICDEGGVTLLEDYSDKYITRDTRIIAKCIMCEKSFNKSLNNLHKQRNFGCESCAKKIKFDRLKNIMVEKYGVEYAAQSDIFKIKMKASMLEKYGVEHPNQSEEVKEKIKKTNLERYGCEYGLQNKEVKEKKKLTYLKNYGVENPLQCKEIKEKCKATCLEKYGVEYASQSDTFKTKIKNTNLEKYGTEYFTQTDIMKDKTKQTVLNKYGVDNISKVLEFRENCKKTCLQKYGVEYAMQCPDVIENNIKSSYYFKEYKMPSGKVIKIQGYENYALDELIKDNINEHDIKTGSKNVPEIWYIDNNGKKHRHFVDIYLPTINKCIEVKSTWTFKKQKDIVFLKQTKAKEIGYLYEIWVYDKKGIKVELYE
jgi:hypothetical protein